MCSWIFHIPIAIVIRSESAREWWNRRQALFTGAIIGRFGNHKGIWNIGNIFYFRMPKNVSWIFNPFAQMLASLCLMAYLFRNWIKMGKKYTDVWKKKGKIGLKKKKLLVRVEDKQPPNKERKTFLPLCLPYAESPVRTTQKFFIYYFFANAKKFFHQFYPIILFFIRFWKIEKKTCFLT